MRRLLALFLVALAVLRVPRPQADRATVSIRASDFPISAEYFAPIEAFTPQQSRTSSLHRRVKLSISNPTAYAFHGALLAIVEFPQGRAPYAADPADPSSYYIEVRDSSGHIATFQADAELTLTYDSNHLKRVGVRFVADVPAGANVEYYLYFDIEDTGRTPPAFAPERSVTTNATGALISGNGLEFFLRYAPIVISPTAYVLNPAITYISGPLNVKALRTLDAFRSGIYRTVFYFYNATYYEITGKYAPVMPTEMLAVINPNYATNGRPQNGNSADEVFGGHGGYLARRFLEPSPNVLPYSDYGRAFAGALYERSGGNFDGNYPTNPTTSSPGRDPDFRRAVGRNASFPRVYDGSTYYSYIAYSNGYDTVSTISTTLYTFYSPMHAIDGIYEHFTAYIEYVFYAPRTAAYTFSFGSDDNLRVRIDGELSINARTLQGVTRYSTSVLRKAGTRHYVQIEYVEGPTRYDLLAKFKVTDPNDPNNVYVADQYVRLDSFAVPYSRASTPNLAAARISAQAGPVFAKISFHDAPVVPLRGVLPDVLDPDFDRYDISFGNASVEYVFLPDGNVYVNASFKPKPDLADDIGLMASMPEDDTPEAGITGAAAGNIAIFQADSFMSPNDFSAMYTEDGQTRGVSLEYSNGVKLIAVTDYENVELHSLSVPLASFEDSAASYPGDASPNGDEYEQKAVGFSLSGRISGAIAREIRIHVYMPTVTSELGLSQVMSRYESLDLSPGLVEAIRGLRVRVLGVSGEPVNGARVDITYLGVEDVNDTSLYLGYNYTDDSGVTGLAYAVFTGNYSVEISFNTSLGRVNATTYVRLSYSDVISGVEHEVTIGVARIHVALAYADGSLINGSYSDISPRIEANYSSTRIGENESFRLVTDFVPAGLNYTISAAIDVYGYEVYAETYVVPEENNEVVLRMPVMPFEAFVAVYHGTSDRLSPIVSPYLVVTLPNDVSRSFTGGPDGYVRIPMLPIGVNITFTTEFSSTTRGLLRITERKIPSVSDHAISLYFTFRQLTIRVTDLDSKPVSAKLTVGGVRLYTNATGYASIEVPDSDYYGALEISASYVEYSYLIPVASDASAYYDIHDTTFLRIQLPMRDVYISVTDFVGRELEAVYRITIYGSIGTIFDGYASGGVRLRHINALPSMELKANVSLTCYGYEVFASKNLNYATYVQNTTIRLRVAELSVSVFVRSMPAGNAEPIEALVRISATNVTAEAYTEGGVADFGYLPMSVLVGDYNVTARASILGIESSESVLVTLDQPRDVSIYFEVSDVRINIVKASGEPAIARLRTYLDGKPVVDEIVNASGTVAGLPLKYVSNVTFEALYRTPYGYLVDEKYSFTGLALTGLREELNATLVIRVGDVNVFVNVEHNVRLELLVGNVSVSLYGSNVTFEEIPYGERPLRVTVYTDIAPAEFEYSVTVSSAEQAVSVSPELARITIHAASPRAELDARVVLHYAYNGYNGTLSIRVPGNVTLEEMPLGEYSYEAVHVTAYGMPVYAYGSFSVDSASAEVYVTFELASVTISVGYSGGPVAAKVTVFVSGIPLAAFGPNVTFEEIPYGERNVSVEYENVATLEHNATIVVDSPEESFGISLPLKDVTIEARNQDGEFVEAYVTLRLYGENLVPGTLSLTIIGSTTLKALPIGTIEYNATYTTPYGIPVSSSGEAAVGDTVTIRVPSGSFVVNAFGENGKPVPVASVRVEFVEYSSFYVASLANGSLRLADFPYGTNVRVVVNGTFHGIYVRSVYSGPSVPEVNLTMPLFDVAFRIVDQDTGGPAAGAKVSLYFNASRMILVESAVADENGYVEFDRVPTEEFLSGIYGEGSYVILVEYKGGEFYMSLSDVSRGEVVVNPPIPRANIVIALLAIGLAASAVGAYYYRRKVLGPYYRLKKAVSKGAEDIDLERLPTREDELLELYKAE